MSAADRLLLPGPSSLFPPGAVQGFPAVERPGSPLAEMEALRRLVTERLAAAVEDILGLFGETVGRYRDHIDRQQRQLDGLRPEEDREDRGDRGDREDREDRGDREDRTAVHLQTCWIKKKPCPDNPDQGDQRDQVVQVVQGDQRDQRDQVVQVVQGDQTSCISSAAHIKTEVQVEEGGASEPDFDPVCGPGAENDGPVLAESSGTEDSGDYWREAEETEDPGRARSSTGPPFTCRVCGESFQRRSLLLGHAPVHLADCGLCGERPRHPDTLKLHLRTHRETSIRCGVCGRSFTLRGNLRTHMRIHSGERPFSCGVCGKSFGRRATLVRHVRSHTGEKPFVCAHCGRGFVEKGNLTVHLRTHTGERPYRCSVCDRRFSQLSCFYKHPCHKRGLNPELLGPS